jgi:transposase
MPGVSRIEIIESSATLRDLMQQQSTIEAKERIQCLYWLKSHQVANVTAVAELLGRHRVTVQGWLSQYRESGLSGLLGEKRLVGGRKSKVPAAVEAELRAVLESRTGFSGYQEVQEWLRERGVELSYGGTHYYVRHHLGASLKVPRPQSLMQDPRRVELFKNTQPRTGGDHCRIS